MLQLRDFVTGANLFQLSSVRDRPQNAPAPESYTPLGEGREFPRRLCDPLPQYDFIVSAVVPL